ncbi:hypothetical protein ACOJUR_08885 [Alicyclobacillus tolerans]|uniref:hypothetical protein n=1 Tax=Alicyclobacillus tolerans TaxID=90970 RepID=UPI003B82BA7E
MKIQKVILDEELLREIVGPMLSTIRQLMREKLEVAEKGKHITINVKSITSSKDFLETAELVAQFGMS